MPSDSLLEKPQPKETEPKQEIKSEASKPKENTKPRTTLNLGNILKTQPKEETKSEEKNGTVPKQNTPVREDELKKVWDEFTEQRRNQVAEYHLLKQDFTFQNNVITLSLTNPVEEPILLSVKVDLLSYLREKLGNSSLNVEGIVQTHQTKKIAYTNKEKFNHLAEKNPALIELKEKMGLDPDF